MANKFTEKEIEIEYLSHSGFIFRKGASTIVVDPFLSGNPLAKKSPDNIKATDVFVTHGHSDHVGDSVKIARNSDCKITATFHTARYLQSQGAEANPMPIGGSMPFSCGLAFYRTAMHSGFHADGSDFGPAASVLFVFDNGLKIYHVGDSALHLDFKLVGEFYKPDIALVPIGGHFTMNTDEAVEAVKFLNPKIAVPMHFNTFAQIKADAEEFKRKVENTTKTKCIILQAG